MHLALQSCLCVISQLSNVPKNQNYRVPVGDDYFQRSQLSRCLWEQGSRAEIRIQRHEVSYL